MGLKDRKPKRHLAVERTPDSGSHWPACGVWIQADMTHDHLDVTCEACRRTLAFRQIKDRQTVKTKVSSMPVFKELK